MPSGAATDATRARRRFLLRLTLVALLVSLAGLVAVTVQFMTQAEQTLRDLPRQADLALRLRQLQGIVVALLDAETGQRGYLLTGNERYLAPYRAALGRLPSLMAALEPVPQDAAYVAGAQAARQAVDAKLTELADTVRLQAQGRHVEAMARVMSDEGRNDMERARTQIAVLQDLVRAQRDRFDHDIAAGAARLRRLLLMAVSSLVVFIGLALAQTVATLGARTRFERELAESERRHRALVEDQSELVSLARADGTLVYVNPAFARHFGRAPEELVGRNQFDLVDSEDREGTRRQVADVLTTGHEGQSETRLVSADGRERWVAWTNKRRLDDSGVLLHAVGRDITDRRRAEQALRASRSFLHRTGRIAGVGGWEHDLRTGTSLWSEEVRRILEVADDHAWTRDEILASYAPEGRATIEKAIEDCIAHGTPFDLELPRFTASGRRIWVRTVASLATEDGQPRRIVGALQDVTERKLLEQRLADSERFLRLVTDSLPVLIAYFDPEGRYLFVNLAHCRRFGLEREQILGRTRSELTHGHTDAVFDRHVAGVLQGRKERFEFEEEMSGSLRRIEADLVPDLGEDGVVKGFFATGVDITEHVANERALRDLTQILEHAPDFVIQTDAAGQVQYMNPAMRAALGLAPDEPLAGRNFTEFNTPQTLERYATEVAPALRAQGAWLGEATLQLAGGRLVPISLLGIAHRDGAGTTERYSAVMRNIEGEVAARTALELQTATLRSVTEAIPATIVVIGRDGRLRFVNGAFERWAGLSRDAALGRPFDEILDASEAEVRHPWAARALAGEMVSFETTCPARRGTRHLHVSYVPLWHEGAVDGYIGVGYDITRHKEEADRLLGLSERDALTGLLNRAGFESFLARAGAASPGGAMAVLYIDLDRFKPVNDSYGHAAGDTVLGTFARRLEALVRPSDAIARLGGDEFAIALAGVRERARAETIAQAIVDAAARPFEAGRHVVSVGASVGIALCEPGEDWHALVARADAMLYKAKAGGRGAFA
jgi:diguanylate cyclase (GGDEF)-like protein/PAS domain S-box-containing protein